MKRRRENISKNSLESGYAEIRWRRSGLVAADERARLEELTEQNREQPRADIRRNRQGAAEVERHTKGVLRQQHRVRRVAAQA